MLFSFKRAKASRLYSVPLGMVTLPFPVVKTLYKCCLLFWAAAAAAQRAFKFILFKQFIMHHWKVSKSNVLTQECFFCFLLSSIPISPYLQLPKLTQLPFEIQLLFQNFSFWLAFLMAACLAKHAVRRHARTEWSVSRHTWYYISHIIPSLIWYVVSTRLSWFMHLSKTLLHRLKLYFFDCSNDISVTTSTLKSFLSCNKTGFDTSWLLPKKCSLTVQLS